MTVLIKRLREVICLTALCLSWSAQAETASAFEQMKKMVGAWQGKLTRSTGEVVETRSEFRLISDGNTLVETLIEDGVEMLTTYSEKDGALVVKHYCALGTEPEFSAVQPSGDQVVLKLNEDSGYHAEHHSFVAAMTYNLSEADSGSVVVDSIIMADGETQTGRAVIQRTN